MLKFPSRTSTKVVVPYRGSCSSMRWLNEKMAKSSSSPASEGGCTNLGFEKRGHHNFSMVWQLR